MDLKDKNEDLIQYSLGLEISTQSCKIIVVNVQDLQIIYSKCITFNDDLKHYNSQNGVYFGENGEVKSNCLMFLEGIDLLLESLKKYDDQNNFQIIKNIKCISYAGQQHGSIYWKQKSLDILQNLNFKQSLVQNLQNAFTIINCPIWMDSSTKKQCEIIENQVGGPQDLSNLTGSKGYERFTGNQILKIKQQQPEIYKLTEHISLISSFIGEIFIGDYSKIDISDGSGMNLMNIKNKQWESQITNLFDDNQNCQTLQEKLNGKPIKVNTLIGKINKYFVNKYGFQKECKVFAGTGDNPSSMIGLGIQQPGDIVISLGTSDTLFGILDKKDLQFRKNGHVLVSPINPDDYMLLLCTKNGGMVREKYKKLWADDSWEIFNQLINKCKSGNNNQIGLFIEYPEILPEINKQNFQYFYDINQQQCVDNLQNNSEKLRALIEGKFISLKIQAQKFGIKKINKILLTGGGAENTIFQQIIADIFQSDVYVIEDIQIKQNSSLFGAAINGISGYLQDKFGQQSTLMFQNLQNQQFKSKCRRVQSLVQQNVKIYEQLLLEYEKLENQFIQ